MPAIAQDSLSGEVLMLAYLQKVVSISIDCDGDAILFQVEQEGAACHTGEFTCFHREIYPAKEENS